MKYPYKLLENNENVITVEMSINKEMDFFDGHFEGQPIMPAVAQLYIIEMLARKVLHLAGKFNSMYKVKFIGPICPDTTVIITIVYDPQKGQINYSYSENDVLKSKGELNYCHG